jgi:hypothetical protein
VTFPIVQRPNLPPNTIVPTEEDLFIPYFNRLYEDIAFSVNARDFNFFPITITSTPASIPTLPNFGAYIICVGGTTSGQPTITASLCKSTITSAGSISVLGSQAGTIAPWAGATLTISSTSTNFQINHSAAGVLGNFNVRIIGTL